MKIPEGASVVPPTTNESPVDRSPELVLSPFQKGLEEAVRKLRGRPRHAGVNAIRSLRRAWLIAGIDPEIALFRAITAEEEAATALMVALRLRRYPGSSKLSPWRHADKAGLMVLITVLSKVFADSGWPRPILQLKKDEKPPRIDVHLLSEGFGLPPGYHITPDEPLNLMVHEGQTGEAPKRMTFAKELADLASASGAKTIREHIDSEANLRNQLLYASDQGIMTVAKPDGFLLDRQRRVFVLLGLTIIILQSKGRQLFALQALEAYLAALRIAHSETFDYTLPDDPGDFRIEVKKAAGGEPTASIHRPSKS